MDLSNLSNTLPPTKSLELVSLLNLNSELTDEFKNAAKSVATLYNASTQKGEDQKGVKAEFAHAAKAVASLYRLGTNSNVLLMHKGYLECLDDLLSVIANGEDIENWALTKRAELTNYYNQKESSKDEPRSEMRDSSPVPVSADSDLTEPVLPSEYEFAFPPDLASHTPFRASFPPLSVAYKRSKNHMELKHRKPQGPALLSEYPSALSEAESESSDSSSDADVRRKRKAFKAQHETAKRRKRDVAVCTKD